MARKRKRRADPPKCGACSREILDDQPRMSLTNTYGAKTHVLYFHETFRGCQEAENRADQRRARGSDE